MIRILPHLSIPLSDLWFTFTTSQGPGGQNVNKVASRAVLHFDVANSSRLSDAQKARLHSVLASRINKLGVMQITCGRERTQESNRHGAIEQFSKLLTTALRPRRIRRRTKPTRASVERRLTEKMARSRRKRDRGSFDRD